MRKTFVRIFVILLAICSGHSQAKAEDNHDKELLRQILWIWGNPAMAGDQDTLATFAEASPARRLELLNIPNMIMAGDGIPNSQEIAYSKTKAIKDASHIVWEIAPDGDKHQTEFDYTHRVAQVRQLKTDFPNIDAVLLDDMTTLAIKAGFKPEHIHNLKELLKSTSVKVWGVVYVMNLRQENIKPYIDEIDVINLWTWHSRDLVNLEENVSYCEQNFPKKPIVLGLYLYDYGQGRRMPLDLLKTQCEVALKLAQEHRIKGIVFLTITDDKEVLEWVADWLKKNSNIDLVARTSLAK